MPPTIPTARIPLLEERIIEASKKGGLTVAITTMYLPKSGLVIAGEVRWEKYERGTDRIKLMKEEFFGFDRLLMILSKLKRRKVR